ncbi:dTDP-4-amino-4,6-dideoxygalactose transaminase [Sediminitomix flava]|uniref:dTDP-4-amino-4,6-dideoxygalactose transaminase n=1 Tax=Sediminitomix flava TaxID=379075 RepID=A0A315ZCS0_SEDFL|nr:dTDP-4-amino-4,6-dideoxygalactose transaminase [Sediminitomix flava]PWJ43376.1 dTDP-4-amino-4,6-dideoxygalactose transaminase [Sediminitomix flava]
MSNSPQIPFNKAYLTGKEALYIQDVLSGEERLSGNGKYAKACQSFFEQRYGIKKALMTTSCTHALEMCALLLDIEKGDEVIIPSYTFVSTANAFALRGAKIRFADSLSDHPNVDPKSIHSLITPKTKAIVVVHYAGYPCDMNAIMEMANEQEICVIEDAAQAIEGNYKGKALGSIGHLATFSFHETKNIQCGEGGLLAINDAEFIERAEVIWEKGTNRSAFLEGKVDHYEWVDLGSSYLPSELNTAFLYGQLEEIDNIQLKRKEVWNVYKRAFEQFSDESLKSDNSPILIQEEISNAHMFYVLFEDKESRDRAIVRLKSKGFQAVFHYQSLHRSLYFKTKYEGEELQFADYFSDCLLRLPFHHEMNEDLVFQCVESLLEI